ncbi:MAG: hypothetical protein H6627_14780 [Calditrichae bacterium]|nr:hypothetical protein [Calditrichota bacterium]MCB9059829.1 hypothetical protein [Calditrichia bacterium]
MPSLPNQRQIKHALIAAAKAHHEFETNYLAGIRHEQWAYWYAAFVLGNLGNFLSPSKLTQILENVTDSENWFKSAAEQISEILVNQ